MKNLTIVFEIFCKTSVHWTPVARRYKFLGSHAYRCFATRSYSNLSILSKVCNCVIVHNCTVQLTITNYKPITNYYNTLRKHSHNTFFSSQTVCFINSSLQWEQCKGLVYRKCTMYAVFFLFSTSTTNCHSMSWAACQIDHMKVPFIRHTLQVLEFFHY